MSQLLHHKHVIVDALVQNPPLCTKLITTWMEMLIDSIGMKIMMGPYSSYCEMVGNRGLTAVTIIETSHLALHSWDEVSPAKVSLDIYTCGCLDLDKVFNALDQFEPTKIEYKFLDRENGLIMLEEGKRLG